MKIATFHKENGDYTEYTKGKTFRKNPEDYDLIYITSLFTYYADIVDRTINFYKEYFANAEIIVGGIYASLMPERIKKNTGITPHVGIWDKVEFLPPDISYYRERKFEHSLLFTSRGCPNRCGFCAVQKLEPTQFINPRWKEHIYQEIPKIMVHDNNLTATDFSHFKEVMSHLDKLNKPVTFDNGFDCRLFKASHAELLSKLNLESIRFAFDSISQDRHIQKAINLCKFYKIPPEKIMVYILFNYNDSPEESFYRAKEIAKLGVRPYAMQYTPLNATKSFSHYHEKWNKHLCIKFSYLVNETTLIKNLEYADWIKRI